MAEFLDHLRAEISALEQALENDPRFVKLRELRHVQTLYEGAAPPIAPQAGAPKPRRPPPPREMAPATKVIVDATTEFLRGRAGLVPLRDIYAHIAVERGIPISGKDPVNSLSAILSRYGFESSGKSGWRLRERRETDSEADRQGDGNLGAESKEAAGELFCAPKRNGSAIEIHGAADPF